MTLTVRDLCQARDLHRPLVHELCKRVGREEDGDYIEVDIWVDERGPVLMGKAIYLPGYWAHGGRAKAMAHTQEIVSDVLISWFDNGEDAPALIRQRLTGIVDKLQQKIACGAKD